MLDNNFSSIWYTLAGGMRIYIEVSMEVRKLIEQTDRKIRSQRRQDRRRHTEYVDGLTDTATVFPHEDNADLVHRMDSYKQLYAAIDKLSGIQRRRVNLYYFCGFTYRQIAELDGVGFACVARSIYRSHNKLRLMLSE